MNARILIPAVALFLCIAVVVKWAIPPSKPASTFQVHEFGKIPVVADGRVKPFDAFARESLLKLNRKQTWTDDEGRTRSAIEWLLTIMSRSPEGEKIAMFRIDHPQVRDVLGLSARPGFRYSLADIGEKLPQLIEQAQKADAKESDQRDLQDRKVLELAHGIMLIRNLREAMIPLAVPPQQAGSDKWTPLGLWNRHFVETGQTTRQAVSLTLMLASYANGNVDSFNSTVRDYLLELRGQMPGNVSAAAAESWFRHFEPFYHGAVLYALAFVLAVLGLLMAQTKWGAPLLRSATWIVVFTAVVHTFALIMRMYLQGRPPVTNLYASAIFIGWGAVLLGLFLERIYRMGLGTVVASVIGFATLIIAHLLAQDGSDTLEMQRAVLDTNFWLATHVTCITLGYTAVFVAGLLGIIFIFQGFFTPNLVGDRMKRLGSMIYGVLCFATFLSFTGTVLGGIWADQSWGRFWGWDPKENGALMIVIWCALILHARWAGMVQQRGVAVLSVFGNVVTAWSWFGVNELGVGLHSYGFTDGTKLVLLVFVLSQLAIIALGCMPRAMWRSFGGEPRRTLDTPASPGGKFGPAPASPDPQG